MLTILDYIEKYNYSFDEKEINEIDMLILSQFTMVKFENVLKNLRIDDKSFSFQNFLDILTSVTNLDEYNYIRDLYKQELFSKLVISDQDQTNLTLLKLLCASRRFRDLEIKYHVDRFEVENEKQFSATCFIHKNKFSVMAFRGTDMSFVGWKEDFNLAYQDVIPAQDEALQYINTVYRLLPKKLYVCGHSKGGNLAVYASMFCRDDIRNNIEQIYTFDGPGFPPKVANSREYRRIVSRTVKIVPENSIIGLVLNTVEPIRVIHSSEFWIMEHDPYSWEITKDMKLKYLDDVSKSAKKTKASINEFYDYMSTENKKEFINQLYEILISTGVDNFADLAADWGKYLPLIMNKLVSIDKSKRDLLLDTFSSLGRFRFRNMVKPVNEDTMNHLVHKKQGA